MNKFKSFSTRKLTLENALAERNRRLLVNLQERRHATTIMEPPLRRLDHLRSVGPDEVLADCSLGQVPQTEPVQS